jgi:2'-5' RNA ligase
MRLFLAIELPVVVREHLHIVQMALAPQLDARVSLTRDPAMHVTLRFIGEANPSQLQPILESLATVRGGPLGLRANGVACFPDRGAVRIIAATFDGDVKRLNAIHAAIDQRCAYLRFRREDRPFKAHVTLARARPVLPPATRQRVTDLTASLWPGPPMTVGAFALLQSRLTPGGSQYTKLRAFSLGT